MSEKILDEIIEQKEIKEKGLEKKERIIATAIIILKALVFARVVEKTTLFMDTSFVHLAWKNSKTETEHVIIN